MILGGRYGWSCSCGLSKDYGAGHIQRDVEAEKHARRLRHHRLELWTRITTRLIEPRDVTALPDDAPPPF